MAEETTCEQPPKEESIDYYSLCVPYKVCDTTLLRTMFPYSKETISSFLQQQRIGNTINDAYFPPSVIKPVSLLEELSNILIYFDLLYSKDFEVLDEVDQMLFVLKFILASWSSVSSDVYLPCAPYRGETFACYVNTSKGKVTFIAEACSVHADCAAFYIEDEIQCWRIEGIIKTSNLFAGSSIQIYNRGSLTITHIPTDSKFEVTYPMLFISGLLFGIPEIQLTDDAKITRNNSNQTALMSFLPRPEIGGDSKVVRVLINKDSTVIYRIQGKWDIGYEVVDNDGDCDVLLVIDELLALQRYVLRDNLQGPLESQQVWKELKQIMVNSKDNSEVKSVYQQLEKKKKNYYLIAKKKGCNKPILFVATEDGYEYRFKNEKKNVIELSRNVNHIEVPTVPIESLL